MTPEQYDRIAADLRAIPVDKLPLVISRFGSFDENQQLTCGCPLTHLALLAGAEASELHNGDGGVASGVVCSRVQQQYGLSRVAVRSVYVAFDDSEVFEAECAARGGSYDPKLHPLFDARLFQVLMMLASHLDFPPS